MKIHYLIVYIAAGAAFLGVSLWVFLSGGKNARAIRSKYRLGGILLTAWSMLTAASCTGGPPQVTCYEPAVPPEVMCYDVAVETDVVHVEVKDYGGRKLKPGDVMIVTINSPSYKEYHFSIHAGDSQAPVIQEFTYKAPDVPDNPVVFEQELAPTDFRGAAVISVIAMYAVDGNGEEIAKVVSEDSIYIEIVG